MSVFVSSKSLLHVCVPKKHVYIFSVGVSREVRRPGWLALSWRSVSAEAVAEKVAGIANSSSRPALSLPPLSKTLSRGLTRKKAACVPSRPRPDSLFACEPLCQSCAVAAANMPKKAIDSRIPALIRNGAQVRCPRVADVWSILTCLRRRSGAFSSWLATGRKT